MEESNRETYYMYRDKKDVEHINSNIGIMTIIKNTDSCNHSNIKNVKTGCCEWFNINQETQSIELSCYSLCNNQQLTYDTESSVKGSNQYRKACRNSMSELIDVCQELSINKTHKRVGMFEICMVDMSLKIQEYQNFINNNDTVLKNIIIKNAFRSYTSNTINESYLSRLYNQFGVFHITALINASILIKNSKIKAQKTSGCFRIIFVAFCILSLKYYDDYSVYNSKYKSSCDMTLSEIFEIEKIALSSISYNVKAELKEFNQALLIAYSERLSCKIK